MLLDVLIKIDPLDGRGSVVPEDDGAIVVVDIRAMFHDHIHLLKEGIEPLCLFIESQCQSWHRVIKLYGEVVNSAT